jgi:hypothetical protein
MANLVNTTMKKYLEKVLEKQKKSLWQQAIGLVQFSRFYNSLQRNCPKQKNIKET